MAIAFSASAASYAGSGVRRRFSAPLWAWLATAAGVAALSSLGSWQVHRAQAKQALLASYQSAAYQRALPLTASAASPASGQVVSATAQGHYLAQRQLLLDNQSHRGQPGYRVWTPLQLEGGGLIIVDRGWIPGHAAKSLPELSVSPAPRSVRGLWRDLPQPGLRLAGADAPASGKFPVVVQYPTAEQLWALLGQGGAAGILLLDPAEPDGFVRDWNPAAEFPPSRHYGYAVQWFALAATLVVIFVVVNLKASP
jgi:surfeit locus 1 family protein